MNAVYGASTVKRRTNAELDIVDGAIEQHIDPEALRLTQIAEQSERDILTSMIGG